MANQYSNEEMENLKETFDMFDKDRNNTISLKEFGKAMRALGQNPTQHQLKNIIKNLDENRNGSIDFDEFTKFYQQVLKEENTKEDIQAAFKIFDRDGNGLISANDLKHVMTSVGEKLTDGEIKDMLKVADIDGDGNINYKEFSNFLTTSCSSKRT